MLASVFILLFAALSHFGTSSALCLSYPDCCYEPNTDYYGNDIGGWKATRDAFECQVHCRHTNGCMYFTWNPHTKHCWAKTSANGRKYFRHAISGQKYCCFENNFDYYGNDIGSWKVTRSAGECQERCRITGGCNYFSWNPHNKHCWVKTTSQGRKYQENHISGYKKACVSPGGVPILDWR